MLWVDSSVASGVFAYSLPDLKLVGNVATGSTPDWLTFTPDSRFVYVANAGENYVSAVDTKMLKEVARIPVGEAPKRNGTVVLP
jgi:YVTN family beta-propeller protein